ncbi:MAG: hypothetical protein LUQ69_10635 [Methanoregulaceae archaeon]|jgi:hypothetical protein|nr:hypothetical protein [Methanoregulaceae archaeon]
MTPDELGCLLSELKKTQSVRRDIEIVSRLSEEFAILKRCVEAMGEYLDNPNAETKQLLAYTLMLAVQEQHEAKEVKT